MSTDYLEENMRQQKPLVLLPGSVPSERREDKRSGGDDVQCGHPPHVAVADESDQGRNRERRHREDTRNDGRLCENPPENHEHCLLTKRYANFPAVFCGLV